MLESLLKLQTQLNMTEAEFANHLHIPRSTWNHTVAKRRPISMTIISAVLAYAPELTLEALAYQRSLAKNNASAEIASAAPGAIAIEDSERTERDPVGATK